MYILDVKYSNKTVKSSWKILWWLLFTSPGKGSNKGGRTVCRNTVCSPLWVDGDESLKDEQIVYEAKIISVNTSPVTVVEIHEKKEPFQGVWKRHL